LAEESGSRLDVPEEAVEAAKTAMVEHIPGCGPRPAAFSPDINSAAWAAIEAVAPALRKQGAEEERERIRTTLPDPEKLRLLAAWFDSQQADGRWGAGREVQTDLRKWADDIGGLVAALDNLEASR
jgi:hypothetical protein